MERFFGLDSPVLAFLNRLCDLVWLNILTFICCLPVITAGASLTAMHYVTMKMVRNEESYITRSFFHSFRQNFRQATLIWALILLFLLVMGADFYALSHLAGGAAPVLRALLAAALLLFLLWFLYIFPVLARFENTLPKTVKNAFIISIMYIPRTVLIAVIDAVPIALGIFLPLQTLPLLLLLGLSLPAYVCGYVYRGVFDKL